MMKTLLWFTHDLRASDHPGLSWARRQGHQIVGMYAFDDRAPIQGPRYDFIKESLVDLSLQLKKINIPLVVFGHEQQLLALDFIAAHKINRIVLSKAHNFRKKIWQKSLENRFSDVTFHYFSHDTLLNLEHLGMSAQEMPDVFTNFRKKAEQNWSVEELISEPTRLENDIQISTDFKPFVFESETSTDTSKSFAGGRSAGLKRLEHYLWNSKAVLNYKQTRNGLLNFDDSSKFSPWLSLGCISAKEIYWQIKKFESDVEKNESTYWLIFELLWRDYFKFLAEKYQQKIFLSSGLSNPTDLPWPEASGKNFELWKNGQTDDAFINANMLELSLTGWMSNRGRQNVANYLVKTLKVDWILGAQWFEENLIDYDCESNWGNWLYQSGLGTDPRDRIFNPQIQAHQYDPNREYQNKWLTARGLK